MNIRQISASDPLTKLVIDALTVGCKLLDTIEFYTKTGPADSIKKARESAEPDSAFRAINEDLTATKPTNTYDPATKKIVSGESTVDVVLEQRNEDPFAELETQTKNDGVALGYKLQTALIQGSVALDSESFDGYLNLVAEDQIVTPAAPLELIVGTEGAERRKMVEAVEYILRMFGRIPGGATHAIANNDLISRLIFLGKELGFYKQSKDEFGNNIDELRNVKLVPAGYNSNLSTASLLLPFTETVAGSGVTSSIILARFGEKADVSHLCSKGVVAEYIGRVKKQYVNSYDLDMTPTLHNDRSLMRLKGFQLEPVAL